MKVRSFDFTIIAPMNNALLPYEIWKYLCFSREKYLFWTKLKVQIEALYNGKCRRIFLTEMIEKTD